ncbi:MAG: membrane protein insertase YidC [Acidobacteria bacterium]|nr:membrane protein insertase YidC [Acidobacteriota bacterium]
MENENQSNPRFILFIVLSILIFLGYSYAHEKLYPTQKPKTAATTSPPAINKDTQPTPTTLPQSPRPQASASISTQSVISAQTELREIHVKSDFWRATLSNQGAVFTEWTMLKSSEGTLIDAQKGGVNLISAKLSQEVGGFLRFHIPADTVLEQELNTARFVVENFSEQEVSLNRGDKKEIVFSYANVGVIAQKKLILKGVGAENGSGYDFDFQAEVTRNGQPLEAFIVIGPNFGDQGVVEVNTYKHAPQITYALGKKVYREQGASVAKSGGTKSLGDVAWAAVDDNYFAMAVVPPQPVSVVALDISRNETINNKEHQLNFVSVAVRVNPGQLNRVYAGPKNIGTLGQISANFGLGDQNAHLEDIISYGILDFISFLIKPIARFMLGALRAINQFTHNWGWSIVILTVLLNMIFFPLRWRSSVMMKKAAAMQPKMKELQDEMKKLDKNDPRTLELQRKQLELMKEGNPLMGCLPLLLQMPFFVAVYAILTVSIEVRHAPFIGWLKDLSSPDPYWLLPIIMCVTMIAQTALTPSTADPL